MNCPTCNRPLPPPEQSETGIERYFCDCAGFRRAVVEIIPEPSAEKDRIETVNNPKKKGNKDDRSN